MFASDIDWYAPDHDQAIPRTIAKSGLGFSAILELWLLMCSKAHPLSIGTTAPSVSLIVRFTPTYRHDDPEPRTVDLETSSLVRDEVSRFD